MTTVYPGDTSRCALCEGRVRTTRYAGLYVVGNRAAIGYALCNTCGKQATRGLQPDQLRKLDSKLEAEAVVGDQPAYPVSELRRILGVA